MKSLLISKFNKASEEWDYAPMPINIDDSDGCIWIRSNCNCDKLMFRLIDNKNEPEVKIFEAEYISEPSFSAGQIVFSAKINQNDWGLFSAKPQVSKEDSPEVTRINLFNGKIDFIRAGLRDSNYWIVYEGRDGVKTQIFAARYSNEEWVTDIPITDASFNAYDPHIAIADDGFVYIVFCAFIHGNYNIMAQKIDINGSLIGEAYRISDQKGMCFWPSVCSRKDGGIWITWSSFTRDVEFETTYLQHYKYAARRRLFTNHAEIYAGVLKNDKLYFFNGNGKGYIEPLLVEGSRTAKQPVIYESSEGKVIILHRYYFGENVMSKSPGIAMIQWEGDGWSESELISGRGLHEGFPRISNSKNEIVIAYAEDNRNYGWNKSGEYFDETNTVDIIYKKISLNDEGKNLNTKNQIVLKEHFISPTPFPGIEENDYNEIAAIKNLRDTNVIWGQTHCHSDLSVCQRMNDQNMDINYRYFQDVQKSLFGGTSDHEYNMWPLEQKLVNKKADYYYFPGKFIAFPAYEWTGSAINRDGGPFGHVNPIYLEEKGRLEIYTAVDENSDGSDLNKLCNEYKGKKIITIPHHTADKNHTFNWDFFNEDMMPIAEIFQDCRGEQEQEGVYGSTAYHKALEKHSWILDALNRGYRFGFIGGGDHSGIARAGVEVKELTRTALYDAFMRRRTYAGTGAGADLCFKCNGDAVGSVLKCEKAIFEFYACTNCPIVEIKIVKNGIDFETVKFKATEFNHKWEYECISTKNFWYIRMLLENGEVFWTSPIWVSK